MEYTYLNLLSVSIILGGSHTLKESHSQAQYKKNSKIFTMTTRMESEFIADRIADFVFVQEKKSRHELSLNIESLLRTVLPNEEMSDYRDHRFEFDNEILEGDGADDVMVERNYLRAHAMMPMPALQEPDIRQSW